MDTTLRHACRSGDGGVGVGGTTIPEGRPRGGVGAMSLGSRGGGSHYLSSFVFFCRLERKEYLSVLFLLHSIDASLVPCARPPIISPSPSLEA